MSYLYNLRSQRIGYEVGINHLCPWTLISILAGQALGWALYQEQIRLSKIICRPQLFWGTKKASFFVGFVNQYRFIQTLNEIKWGAACVSLFFIPVEIIMKYLRWDLSSHHYSPTLGKLWRRRTRNQKKRYANYQPTKLKRRDFKNSCSFPWRWNDDVLAASMFLYVSPHRLTDVGWARPFLTPPVGSSTVWSSVPWAYLSPMKIRKHC